MHVWNLLALHMPNALPRSVPWLRLHDWHISVVHSQWPRHAGRLIWASVLLFIGIVVGFILIRRPKPAEPATWAQTIVGALLVWVLMVLAFGTVPHEWLNFGNSYLNFNKATWVVRQGQLARHLPPFAIPRSAIVDGVAALMYVVFIGLFVYMCAAWQKRPVREPVAVADEEGGAPPQPAATGPFARLRARRDKRVSAYGRPVTTPE